MMRGISSKYLISAAGICLATLMASSAQAALVISDKATENVTCDSGVCSATAKQAVLNVSDLTTMLAAGSVTIQSGDQAQDITINAPFSWTSSNALTLDADKSLTVNKPVSDAGPAALTLSYGKKGDLRFGPKGDISFTSTANSLTINKKAYMLVDSIASLASAVAKKPSGLYALAHNYDASKDGTYTASPIATPLTGTFEGLGNVISNLTVAVRRPNGVVGFIAEIGAGGIMRDVGVTSAVINSKGANLAAIGVLAGVVGTGGAIWNVFASGQTTFVFSGSGLPAGGLVGENVGTISNSYADVTVKPRNGLGYVGGLAGRNAGLIDASFATGKVAINELPDSGGLAGINLGSIRNCYATGSVGGSVSGGLVGVNGATIGASYSTGRLKSNSEVGGLIGEDDSPTGSLENTYWDVNTSGISDPSQGAGNVPNDPGITGLADAKLKAALPVGFDPKVWTQSPKINYGYPYLIHNPPPW